MAGLGRLGAAQRAPDGGPAHLPQRPVQRGELSVTLVFLALFGWLFVFTQQLQFVLGFDPLQAGVRALPFAVTIGLISQPAARLAARVGTKLGRDRAAWR